MGGDLRAESGARLHPFPIRNQSVLRPMRWIKLLQGAASCLASGCWPSARPTGRPAAAQPGTAALRDQQVAIGILMERLRLDYDRALEALRAQARSEARSVEEIAGSMVEAANRLNSVAR